VTDCNSLPIEFPGFGGRKIQADFSDGQVSSDGGVLLIRQVDRWIGLTKRLGELLPDPRDPDRITHSLETLLQQRIYGLALGYEDLNDHDALRHDLLWQTAAERDEALGSSSTLCRWENRVSAGSVGRARYKRSSNGSRVMLESTRNPGLNLFARTCKNPHYESIRTVAVENCA
jgi:hypothetical protein